MRVPAVITDEVFALVGDVLGDFGQEIEGAEDLEVAARSASQVGTGRSREAAAVVLFGPIQHRPVVRQADHASQAEGTTQDVLGQALQTGGVARGQIDAVVDAEAGVGPAAHLVHGRLVDFLGRQEQVEDLGLPCREQAAGVELGQADERPIGQEPAVGGNRVDVRMKMDQLAEGLNARDQPGDQIVPAEHVANHFDHAFPSGAGQFAEQAPVVAEDQAEPFGDGEDQLPVGNGLADGVGNRVGGQQGAFLMATGAQAALAAGEGDEHLVPAVRAADAGEAEVQVAAAEELAGDVADDRPP